MQFCPLSSVRQRITVGLPLPFNVRNADHTLLLARGQVIGTQDQMEALFERGALVDTDELKPRGPDATAADAAQLPGLWDQTFERVSRTLKAAVHTNFNAALNEVCAPVLALVERDPDLAIFQIVRQEVGAGPQYGVSHSMHAAIACRLAAQRLGWNASDVQRVFKAAMTMNISMIELQGRLSLQPTPVTPLQRQAIREHPIKSMQMLQSQGVDDQDWLDAVGHHHESPDGKGYPSGTAAVGDMAQLLRRADIYTAKLASRANRGAMPPHEAARKVFTDEQGHPMAAALVKEFGVYPPGTCVRLASGEVGVVVKRGPSTNTPVVASLMSRQGEALMEPVRRDTGVGQHAVVGVVSDKTLKVRISRDKLAAIGQTS